MSATGYTIQWLRLREKYDASARNQDMVTRVNNYIHTKSQIHIADFGAGVGSNFNFWKDKIQIPCAWDWVEIDGNLTDYAIDNDIAISPNKQVSIFTMDFSEYLQQNKIPDLIMSNALLDVLTIDQLRILLKYCIVNDVPLFSTINYLKTIMTPADPQDIHYLMLYDRHMIRKQENGYAIGPKIDGFMQSLHPIAPIINADSNWDILPEDVDILDNLLNFIEISIPELLSPDELPDFYTWINTKRNLLEKGILSIRVHHKDYWMNYSLQSIG